MARARSNKGLARFERIALVLSGGAALGAYQAGAYAGLENSGVRPNWIAGSAIGAINAVLIAGNPPHQSSLRLRQFWHELGQQGGQRRGRLSRLLPRRRRGEPAVSASELRRLLADMVDFDRLNNGTIRVVLGAVDLASGAETYFDNDRHVLGLDHVLAGTPLPDLPPVAIHGHRYGGGAVMVPALEDAHPADTLCYAIDGYDPAPGGQGISRSAREIATIRRFHDLRRMIALLGERLPSEVRGESDIGRCLAEASAVTMTILHLVHEGNAAGLPGKIADFSAAAIERRWRAGEADAATSLAHPMWLAPPPRRLGVVVHEVRGGVVAPPR